MDTFQAAFQKRLQDADSIGLDIPVQSEYPSFTQRYFSSRYKIDSTKEGKEDHCVLVHSNRVCVVTLALTHPLISPQKEIVEIDFQVSDNTNRLNNSVKGKRKHGAQLLKPHSVLCVVKCADGSEYSVRSCVHGKLLEINESLLEKPQLLMQKPGSDGYVAIVLPNKLRNEKEGDGLISHEEYMKAVQERRLEECQTCI